MISALVINKANKKYDDFYDIRNVLILLRIQAPFTGVNFGDFWVMGLAHASL